LNPKELEQKLEGVQRRSTQEERLPEPDTLAATSSGSTSPTLVIADDTLGDSVGLEPDFHPFIRSVHRILASSRNGEPFSVIDVNDIFTRAGESPRRTLLVLRSFIGCYGDILLSLQQHAATRDTEEIGKAAHALKGLAAEAGAADLTAKACSLEQLVSGGDLPSALPIVSSLVSETESLATVVRKIIAAFDKDGLPIVKSASGEGQPAV
jgi:HPt (histidine-containing phosphotransfer) domain-containing protein